MLMHCMYSVPPCVPQTERQNSHRVNAPPFFILAAIMEEHTGAEKTLFYGSITLTPDFELSTVQFQYILGYDDRLQR